MWLGSEEVKGFGTTLLIGLISSLFTSLFVTRTIFNILIDGLGVKNLSSFPLTFPKWDRLLRPDIDWMGKVQVLPGLQRRCSSSLAGWPSPLKSHQGKLADVDFTGGTQVQFDLRQPMSLEQVRGVFARADNAALGKEPDLTGAGTGDTSYRLVSPNQNARAVRQGVLDVLGDRVTADLPSRFAHVGRARSRRRWPTGPSIPVPSTGITVGDFKVPGTDDFIGGAALVLDNLQPPLTIESIRNRIEQQRAQQQAAAGANGPTFHDFTVVSPEAGGGNTGGPVKTAIVLTAPTPSSPTTRTRPSGRPTSPTPCGG